MSRWQRLLQSVGAALCALALLWLGGFAWFVHGAMTTVADDTTPTDAIVVLTGGRMRVESGIDLLKAGKAHKLFVSGVNQRVHRAALLRAFGPLPDNASCCIVLGHEADNTAGNARETAEWMRREGYRTLRLVTSWYHMPRSRLEFGRAMPEIAIIAHPVSPGRPGSDPWWVRAREAMLAVGEYDKYLGALVRPTFAPLLALLPEAGPNEAPQEHDVRSAGRP